MTSNMTSEMTNDYIIEKFKYFLDHLGALTTNAKGKIMYDVLSHDDRTLFVIFLSMKDVNLCINIAVYVLPHYQCDFTNHYWEFPAWGTALELQYIFTTQLKLDLPISTCVTITENIRSFLNQTYGLPIHPKQI